MSATFPIFVKTLEGYTFTVRCEPNDSIKKLMAAISEHLGIPPDYYRLFFAGKQLDPGLTIDFYRIQTDATLHFVAKLRGD